MKYIRDKNLYSAVMFALRMCQSLHNAHDSKITVAANYYHVDSSAVLETVKQELWERAIKEAKEKASEWYTVYNPDAPKLLGTGLGNDYVFICPKCGAHYSCNIHDDFKIDKIFVSQCSCGFTDNFQRTCVRDKVFKRLYKEE
jgi:hypothetical protein